VDLLQSQGADCYSLKWIRIKLRSCGDRL